MSVSMRMLFYIISILFGGLEIGFAAKNLSEKRYIQFGFTLILAIVFAANAIKCIFFPVID